jgi:hypothetical protein
MKPNAEQKEAEQSFVNEKRKEFIDSLDEKSKEDFEFVEETMREFTKRGIKAYMLADLPALVDVETSLDYFDKSFWQYNNFVDFYEKDDFGVYTKGAYLDMSVNNYKFIFAILHNLSKQFSGNKEHDNAQEMLQTLFNFLGSVFME